VKFQEIAQGGGGNKQEGFHPCGGFLFLRTKSNKTRAVFGGR